MIYKQSGFWLGKFEEMLKNSIGRSTRVYLNISHPLLSSFSYWHSHFSWGIPFLDERIRRPLVYPIIVCNCPVGCTITSPRFLMLKNHTSWLNPTFCGTQPHMFCGEIQAAEVPILDATMWCPPVTFVDQPGNEFAISTIKPCCSYKPA